jgi:carboxymethylenebutenolidase
MAFPAAPSRRAFVIAAGSLIAGGVNARAAAVTIVRETIVVAGRPLQLTRYAAAGQGKRPAVLLLHGSRGLDAWRRVYERQAADLATAGIDAYLFSYYAPDELKAIAAAGSSAGRETCYARFVDGWVALIRAVANHALKQQQSSGKVGLLGISLGGIAAASHPLFSALVVFYGGLPDFFRQPIASLPPLLAIHGDADRNVPLAQGVALVAKARALGGAAELTVYKGKRHGFNLDPANRDAAAANLAAQKFLLRSLAS